MQFFIHFFVLRYFYQLIFYFEKFSIWIWRLPFAIHMKLKLSICHFEVGPQTGSRWLSKCIVGLFWGTNLPTRWKCIPQNNPTMHFDNHLDPVSRATSKWQIGNYEVARESGTKFVPPNSSITQFDTQVRVEGLFTVASALSLSSYSHSTQITKNK